MIWSAVDKNLLWWTICAIIASVVGARKGRPVLGFLLGLLCGPIGILITLLIKGNRRECSHCRERIHKNASICPHCQTEIPRGYGEIRLGNWVFGLVIAIGVILCTAGIIAYLNEQSQSIITSNTAGKPKQIIPPDSGADPNRLNVSEPTFSTAGIRFMLNDNRPNGSLWVSVKIGRSGADKNFMSWISFSGVKSGAVSIPFQDCKYLDEGTYSLLSASKCEVTIGAKLKDTDKIVYTSYDVPISELRTSLVNAVR